MAESARGGQSPCPVPRAQPAKSPRYAVADLSLRASGSKRARGRSLTSVQTRPSTSMRAAPFGNVSAILRPPAPAAVSGRAGGYINNWSHALSPHPCGLPRPSGNVSAILRPPAPAVSVAQVGISITGRSERRPDKAFMPPSGTTTGTVPDRPGIPGSLQRLRQIVALHACVREVGQRHLQLIA